jgi:flagellar secretion chaperone FliS
MPPAAQYRASSAYNSVAAHGGVAAADPHKLILMLMDGALERIALARGRIEHKELSEKNRLLSAAVSIVEELRASLDLKAGGSLAANLDDLYDYMARQLINANLQNKVETLDEVSGLLREIRSAWVLLPAEARTPRGSVAMAIKE